MKSYLGSIQILSNEEILQRMSLEIEPPQVVKQDLYRNKDDFGKKIENERCIISLTKLFNKEIIFYEDALIDKNNLF